MTYAGPDDHDADLFDDLEDVIDCPACGHEIYAYAEKCPACGVWLQMKHRQPKDTRPTRNAIWPWVVGLMILLILLLWFFE